MSDVIIFISNQRVKQGKLAEYKQLYQKVVVEIEATKPSTVAHLAYASQDGSRVSIVHIFPDAEAFERHLIGVDEKARKAFEFMEIESFEIYGKLSQTVLDQMKLYAGSKIALNLKPDSLGGYIHLRAI